MNQLLALIAARPTQYKLFSCLGFVGVLVKGGQRGLQAPIGNFIDYRSVRCTAEINPHMEFEAVVIVEMTVQDDTVLAVSVHCQPDPKELFKTPEGLLGLEFFRGHELHWTGSPGSHMIQVELSADRVLTVEDGIKVAEALQALLSTDH